MGNPCKKRKISILLGLLSLFVFFILTTQAHAEKRLSNAGLLALRTERDRLTSEVDHWRQSNYAESEVIQVRLNRSLARIEEIDRILSPIDHLTEDGFVFKMHEILREYDERMGDKSLLRTDTRSRSEQWTDGDQPSLDLGAIMYGDGGRLEDASTTIRLETPGRGFKFQVLPSTLKISLPEYFQILRDPEAFNLSKATAVVFKELSVLVDKNSASSTREDKFRAVEMMRESIARGRLTKGVNRHLFEAWLKSPLAAEYPEITKEAATFLTERARHSIHANDNADSVPKEELPYQRIPEKMSADEERHFHQQVLEAARGLRPEEGEKIPPIINEWMKNPVSRKYPDIPVEVFKRLSDPTFSALRRSQQGIPLALQTFAIDNIATIFHQPGGADLLMDRPDPAVDSALLPLVIEMGDTSEGIRLTKELLNTPSRFQTKGWNQMLGYPGEIDTGNYYWTIMKTLMKRITSPEWVERHPELIDWALSLDDRNISTIIARDVLSLPQATHHFEWVKALIAYYRRWSALTHIGGTLFWSLAQPQWDPYQKEIALLLNRFDRAKYWQAVFSSPRWFHQPSGTIENLISSNNRELKLAIGLSLLSQKEGVDHVDWFEKIYLGLDIRDRGMMVSVVEKHPEWATTHPELISFLLKNGEDPHLLDMYLFSRAEWKKSRALRKLTFPFSPTAQRLKKALDRGKKIETPSFSSCLTDSLSERI